MQLPRHILLFVLLAVLAPASALARCEGAVMLSSLHDAYEITLNGDERQKRLSAQTLLVIAGDRTGDRLAEQVARAGVPVDASHLSKILEDIRDIALQTLKGSRNDADTFQHGLNINWLAEVVSATRCHNSSAHASLTPTGSSNASAALQSIGGFIQEPKDSIGKTASFLLIGIILAALAGSYFLHKSVFMRKRQVERLPRFPISLDLDLTYTSPEGEIEEAQGEALDISQGGLKLRWEEPPPTGTLTTITLLGIQRLSRVIWANPHYAGVMFEESLTKSELKSLKETHAPV